MKRFEGKIALVVAASRGIGLSCAEGLARGGAKVYLGVRKMDVGTQIAERLAQEGCDAVPVYFDASDVSTYQPMVERVVEAEGRIDILVNNYGATEVGKDLDVVATDVEFFNQTVLRNLDSVFVPVKYAVPYMPKGGSIVNIGSIGGYNPDLARISYCVSKGAIMTLTENIATQYARKGIRCNCVMPGMIATEALLKHMPQQFIDGFLRHVPMQRFGYAEDIAQAVLFLASDDASFITGHCLPVAGGYHVPAPTYGDSAPKMADND